jgi:hypothetical protein
MVHETWVINASKAYWILKFFKGLSNSLTLLPTRRAAVPPYHSKSLAIGYSEWQ